MKRVYLILLTPLLVLALAWWAIKYLWAVDKIKDLYVTISKSIDNCL